MTDKPTQAEAIADTFLALGPAFRTRAVLAGMIENQFGNQRSGDATELLREARLYVDGNHDEGCEHDPEYGEEAFNNRLSEDDPDGERDDAWPKDAKCTCGSDDLLKRIDAHLEGEA